MKNLMEMHIQDPTTLSYLAAREGRPRWVTRLGIASLVFGILGIIEGLGLVHGGWEFVFDSGFRWQFAPPRWAPVAYLFAAAAVTISNVMLFAAGLRSLVQPTAAIRSHLVAPSLVLAAVVTACLLYEPEFWANPNVSAYDAACGFLMNA